MNEPHSSDADQARRAASGDAQAYEAIYRAHVARVYALCLRMARDANEAEELTQEVFVRAWEKLDSFRGESALSTWLHRVAVNVVLSALRKRGRWREIFTPSAESEELAKLEAHGLDGPRSVSQAGDIDLERAVATLPPRARLVFVLHDVEGYKHGEIAALTGTAVGTCKAHLHRARRLLREALER